jgi:dolichol-phosphate mannosyltransferase
MPSAQLFIVLPAYNEEESLPLIFQELANSFVAIGKQQPSWQAPQVIVVDDGSADGTPELLSRAVKEYAFLEVVTHEKNRGLGPAILTGLRAALDRSRCADDVVVCMDADHTHPPEALPGMLARLEAGADLIIASRYQPGSRQLGVPFRRRLLSLVGRLLFTLRLRLAGVRDYTCGYRAYRVRILREGFAKYGDVLIEREGFACTDELLVKLAPFCSRIEEVPFVLRYDRKQGVSKLPFWTTVKATLALLLKKE